MTPLFEYRGYQVIEHTDSGSLVPWYKVVKNDACYGKYRLLTAARHFAKRLAGITV